MEKKIKKKPKKKRSKTYEKKLVVDGTFLEVIKVAMDVDKK